MAQNTTRNTQRTKVAFRKFARASSGVTDEQVREHMHMTEPKATRMGQSSDKFPEDIKGFGYTFNEDGQLRSIKTGEPYEFEVKKGDRAYNQRRYEALGEVITEYVYTLLEEDGHLQRENIPVDKKADEVQGFFFHSPDASTNDKLMILIHGSGVVKAGQWARRLIINNSLDSGTMLPYIRKAKEEGFGVLIPNGNHNYVNVGRKRVFIRGSKNPEEHFQYIWDNFIKNYAAKTIVMVAHSYGGVVTIQALKANVDFMDRVKAVAFTDSVHSLSYQCVEVQRQWMKKHSRNWVSSNLPLDTPVHYFSGNDCEQVSAGTSRHEVTSHAAFKSVFMFFEEKLRDTNRMEEEGDPVGGDKKTEEKKTEETKKEETTKEETKKEEVEEAKKEEKLEDDESNEGEMKDESNKGEVEECELNEGEIKDEPNKEEMEECEANEGEIKDEPNKVEMEEDDLNKGEIIDEPNKEEMEGDESNEGEIKDEPNMEEVEGDESNESEIKDEPNKVEMEEDELNKGEIKDEPNKEEMEGDESNEGEIKDEPNMEEVEGDESNESEIKDEPNKVEMEEDELNKGEIKDEPNKEEMEGDESNEGEIKDEPNMEEMEGDESNEGEIKDKPKKGEMEEDELNKGEIKDEPNNEEMERDEEMEGGEPNDGNMKEPNDDDKKVEEGRVHTDADHDAQTKQEFKSEL